MCSGATGMILDTPRSIDTEEYCYVLLCAMMHGMCSKHF